MTVNELLQKLVELARDGKGQWEVKMKHYDWHVDGEIGNIYDLSTKEETSEVVID